ncbi:MAG: OsmC family protein [Alphaproteobacteria bacterium]
MKLAGRAANHARTDIKTRDISFTIDEPEARGGTNQGPTPTEALVGALIGCLTVVSNRIAENIGCQILAFSVEAEADFDRRGVMMQEAIAVPFPKIDVSIDATIKGTEAQIAQLQSDLAKYCPLSVLIRGSGTELRETWNVTRS